ncbi:expressed unknown protein [Ectocarpus siliculosus]|uniref:Uncharacterized protein n=1 Tax=Ectocarpus siliculosus TaxID=2880 RepID=D7FMN2_ECTSI|nr:expressed unknown protein [Ectocarpus siliculosus]|eukprot:CBJ25929.1 expressed unknown protein [Ectocarpus siliculosus]
MAFVGTQDRVGTCQNIPRDPTPQTAADKRLRPPREGYGVSSLSCVAVHHLHSSN